METIKRLSGGMLIADRHGGTVELDAAEVAALLNILVLPVEVAKDQAAPAGDPAKWHIDADGDLCHDKDYVCSGDPEVNNQTPEGSAEIMAWVLKHQPDITTMDYEYLLAAPSCDVAEYLQAWMDQE